MKNKIATRETLAVVHTHTHTHTHTYIILTRRQKMQYCNKGGVAI